jgi:hypothetical protein
MTSNPAPQLHPDVEPFAFMLGTWRGRGEGSYPTIDDFTYVEEVSFSHVGKPFLAYNQKTKHGETGLPLHAESGYWRFPAIELVIAQPTGIMEALSGDFRPGESGGRFEFTCPDVVLTGTAVRVDRTIRRFIFDGDTLSYDMAMAAVGEPMTHHLSATLDRVVP